MIPKELFQNIRQIEISTSRLVTDIFAGEYHSVFKGQGIEFDEVREYQPGDDVRTIDWNVTARLGKPHIKKFIEERELTVMILVDVSSSQQFGSLDKTKTRLAAEVSAMIALSAIKNNDKVGLIMFSDHIELYIPPRKGRRHVLRLIREILSFQAKGRNTNIQTALDQLNRMHPRKSIAFLISDFITSEHNPDYLLILKKKLAVTHKRHDLIAISINDQRELTVESSGLLRIKDSENQHTVWFDTTSKMNRDRFRVNNQERLLSKARLFQNIGIDHIDLFTDEPYVKAMVQFFHKRLKKN